MNNNNAAAAFVGIFLLFACVLLLGILALKIFFCLSLQRTLSEVRPRNRALAPGLVWLHLLHLGSAVPILGIVITIGAAVWDLIMVLKIGTSLKQEVEDRGWRTEDEGYGRIVGLIWTITQLATAPVGLALNVLGRQINDPTIVMAIAIVLLGVWLISFICWIIYWVQIASYGRRLREGKRSYRRGSVEDDYDDEFRPSRGRYDDDDSYSRRRGRDDDDDRGGLDFNRSRKRDDDDFDDEDDRPRRRSRDDDY